MNSFKKTEKVYAGKTYVDGELPKATSSDNLFDISSFLGN